MPILSKIKPAWIYVREKLAPLAQPISVVCLIISTAFSVYWFFYLPAPGKAVAMLGAVAVFMALRGEIKEIHGSEKVLWTIVVFFLLYIEIRAIDKDRTSAAQEQANARAEQTKNFGEIGRGIQTSIDESKQHFDATMRSSDALIADSLALARLSRKNIDAVTGGKTFCYVLAHPLGEIFELSLFAKGDSPLHETFVELTDRDEVKKIEPLTFEAIQEHTNHYSIPFVEEKSGHLLGQIPMGQGSARTLRFNFFSMNGTWGENMKLLRVNGHWMQAIQIVRQGKNKAEILYEDIPKDFPRTSGKIDWF